jgi:hypothetical protein
MSYQGKKVVGIWMDQTHAFIISTSDRTPEAADFAMLKRIDRDDHSNDVYKNESAELKKNTAEIKKYHKAITDEIINDEAIYIFGPGKAQEGLKNVLKDNHQFRSKEITLGTTSKMSINQMIERVRSVFEV